MESIFAETVLIILLILANGFFAGSELAIISARKSTMARLAGEGDRRARLVEALQRDPHRFLATVQIGVTMVGSLASAVGGATAIRYLQPLLAASPLPFIHDAAEPLALALVVFALSYATLIFGELAPKTVGLQQADRMALLVAGPIQTLATVAGWAVRFLTFSNRIVLALIGIKPAQGQDFITREELLHAVAQGGEAGTLSELEHKVIENLLEFSQTQVREVMVPRPRMVALDIGLPRAALLQVVREQRYTRYPVYRDHPENIVGLLHTKDLLLHPRAGDDGFDLVALVRPPSYVLESKRASELLREMQRNRRHMALVVDEYGVISGLVTTEDLLEELVGEIEDEHDIGEQRRAERLPDGSLLVDGLISLRDLAKVLGIEPEGNLPYDTLAGLILKELGRFPSEGESLFWQDYRFVCVAVTPTSVVQVQVFRKDQAAGG